MRRALAIAGVVGAIAASARADVISPDPELLAASRDYFAGERAQGAAWGAVGAATVAVGAIGLASDSDLARGAAIPLLTVGAIQLGAAVVSYISPPRRRRHARIAIASDPAGYRRDELRRMHRVELAFDILEVTEVAVVLGGVAFAYAGSRRGNDVWVGAGGGLVLQGLAMLALDSAAHARAYRYLERLSLTVDDHAAGVSFTTPF